MNSATLLAYAGAGLAALLAVVVIREQRRSIAHWCFALGMLLVAVENVFVALTLESFDINEIAQWQYLRLITVSLSPVLWLIFSLTYARGNYRDFLSRWRAVWVASAIVPIAAALWIGVRHQALIIAPQIKVQEWILRLNISGSVLNIAVLLSTILSLINLERTFRDSVGTMRWRIKFIVLGVGLFLAVRAYTTSQVLLFRSIDPQLLQINSAALLLGCLVITRSLFRPGHFDQNVYPSKNVLHNSLTVVVTGVYLLIVGVLAKVITYLGSSSAGFTEKALAVLITVVGITVLLTSERVRHWTRRFFSSHFQRPLYDYRKVWKTFTDATASRVEQSELSSAVAKMLSELFQALSVSIWIVDEANQSITNAASTSLSQQSSETIRPTREESFAIITAMRSNPDPQDIDARNEDWAATLRRCHPNQFKQGGHRVAVSMNAGGELLGIIILGDRVSEVPFVLQDFEILKTIADQTAATLRNIQLSQRLAQGKEMQAFQTMSTFFVHDLKNTASTLSLMLQNLPVHFNDPAFREDALRGIGKTVNHINDLIRRLSMLREQMPVRPVETDLNKLVQEALKCVEGAAGIEVSSNFAPLPSISIDPEQVQKVVTNLLLNSKESMTAGKIEVQTAQQTGWAVITVSDTGAGMTPEFMTKQLFRPFQTTKKQGIGIGMFQSRMIVEAHGGRMEVQSELGKGTTFRVLFPFTSKAT
ncbi:MAG: zraS 6 [Verrucomicrobiales bacterium]|nr:zraS 6 [Verrucomicrobiales bacterium]